MYVPRAAECKGRQAQARSRIHRQLKESRWRRPQSVHSDNLGNNSKEFGQERRRQNEAAWGADKRAWAP